MLWTPEQPICLLPGELMLLFQKQAEFLYADLMDSSLKVILVPAPRQRFDSHMIRAVNLSNPAWYQKLFAENLNFRRDRSEAALERICELEDKAFDGLHYRFDSIYRELIKDQLSNGFELEKTFIPPEEAVAEYFSNEINYRELSQV